MATRVSYKPLQINVGYLKWLPVQAQNRDEGITQLDLEEAELWARDKINLWLVETCGQKRGTQIVEEFLDDTNDIDPVIVHLAEIIGAARVSQIWESRNFEYAGPDGQTRRKTFREYLDDAIALMKDVRRTGYTLRSDGTIRKLRIGMGRHGPVVGGPMSSGSLFDDSGLLNDKTLGLRRLPHIHPLDKAT